MENLNKKYNVNEHLEFTDREYTAILLFTKKMTLADGRLDDREKIMLVMEAQRFGIGKNKLANLLDASDNMEADEAIALIATMTDAQKRYVSALLGTIMAIDGDIDDKELALWQMVSFVCKLPEMSINDAIEYMRG